MVTTAKLTLEEYDRLYGFEAGWEFRDGKAIRKPVPTYLHGLLALVLGELLKLAGYHASVEADVRLPDNWSPRPDACGVLAPVMAKYPTHLDVVCEILSEKEEIVTKCRDYHATGAVGQIFVFEIESKTIWTWNGVKLVTVVDLLLGNGVTITGRRIWRELETTPVPPASMLVD